MITVGSKDTKIINWLGDVHILRKQNSGWVGTTNAYNCLYTGWVGLK